MTEVIHLQALYNIPGYSDIPGNMAFRPKLLQNPEASPYTAIQ